MRYSITLEFDNQSDLSNFVDTLEGLDGYGAPTPAKTIVKKKKPVEVAEDDEPAPKPKAKPKAKPAEDDEGLDYETEVRPHVVGLSKDHGRDVAVEVLSDFENPATGDAATKGQEVDPADYPRLLKAIKKKRAELDD